MAARRGRERRAQRLKPGPAQEGQRLRLKPGPIGSALHVSQTAASLLVTAAQLGYAAGLLLVVPIGDIVRRRPLLPGCWPPTRWRWPRARSPRISPSSARSP